MAACKVEVSIRTAWETVQRSTRERLRGRQDPRRHDGSTTLYRCCGGGSRAERAEMLAQGSDVGGTLVVRMDILTCRTSMRFALTPSVGNTVATSIPRCYAPQEPRDPVARAIQRRDRPQAPRCRGSTSRHLSVTGFILSLRAGHTLIRSRAPRPDLRSCGMTGRGSSSLEDAKEIG